MRPILIVVSTFNRRDLTGITLDSVKRNKSACSDVLIIDDASTEYHEPWLKRWGFEVLVSEKNVGVGLAAFRRFAEFVTRQYQYLCALDNDVLLARHFDLRLMNLYYAALQENGVAGWPTVASGYRSVTQRVSEMPGASSELLWGSTVNGISQFTDLATARQILDTMENRWQHEWDRNLSCVIPRIALPKRSLIQHLGVHGTGVNGLSDDVAVDFVGDGS